MRIPSLLGSLLIGFLATASSHADVLLLETINEAADSTTSRPAHGVSMASVEAQYGTPESTIEQIGEPPITRWIYPDFTIYFEFNKVIHSVYHRPNSAPGALIRSP